MIFQEDFLWDFFRKIIRVPPMKNEKNLNFFSSNSIKILGWMYIPLIHKFWKFGHIRLDIGEKFEKHLLLPWEINTQKI